MIVVATGVLLRLVGHASCAAACVVGNRFLGRRPAVLGLVALCAVVLCSVRYHFVF